MKDPAVVAADLLAQAERDPSASSYLICLSEEFAAAVDAAGPSPTQPLPFVRPSTPLKDRFNYLTSDVGAKVLATSDGMKNAGHILDGDRDRRARCTLRTPDEDRT